MTFNSAGEPDWILRFSYPSSRRDLEDRVERVLFLSGSAGSTIDENGERTVVRLYFVSPDLRAEARAMLPDDLDDLEIVNEEGEHVDWLEYYEHSLEPIEVGDGWIVVPDRRLLPEGTDRLPLVIPQERAFGTGSHETTALCLTMLETLELFGTCVVDVGTGSGILAIAMEKLGADRIVAFDNDVDTWDVVRQNLERNGVPRNRIDLFFGTVDSLSAAVSFDVVTMNIIAEVIIPALPEVVKRVAPRGSVILSGILRERSTAVVDRASDLGLRLADHRDRGEWWCGRFIKSG